MPTTHKDAMCHNALLKLKYFLNASSKTLYPTSFSILVSTSSTAQTVFKTPSGAKYHLATCRMVKNVSEEITVDKARELGLQPCKISQPEIIDGFEAVNHKAQGQKSTVQCKGLTKAGIRCRHMTSIGNGFCFQHQP